MGEYPTYLDRRPDHISWTLLPSRSLRHTVRAPRCRDAFWQAYEHEAGGRPTRSARATRGGRFQTESPPHRGLLTPEERARVMQLQDLLIDRFVEHREAIAAGQEERVKIVEGEIDGLLAEKAEIEKWAAVGSA